MMDVISDVHLQRDPELLLRCPILYSQDFCSLRKPVLTVLWRDSQYIEVRGIPRVTASKELRPPSLVFQKPYPASNNMYAPASVCMHMEFQMMVSQLDPETPKARRVR